MSLAQTHRMNRMYNHQTSVEERKPAPEISPSGHLRLRQDDEIRRYNAKAEAESTALADKQQTEKNGNITYRNGGGVPYQMAADHEEEHQILGRRFAGERAEMHARHRRETEHLLSTTGVAP